MGISNFLTEEKCGIDGLLGELVKTCVCGKMSVSLWPNLPNDIFCQKIYKLGIWNGISIALPFNNYIDIFSFASTRKNCSINNFYLNHLRLLKRFIIFFRLKAKKVIELTINNNLRSLDEKIILYSDKQVDIKLTAVKTLREMISPRKVSIQASYFKKISLTKRETTYLVMLLEGKSMSKIAKELSISQRSVESCLETIKSKTGYNTKTELLSAFLESQIYQPSINYDRCY